MSDAIVQSATIQLKAQAGGGFGSVPATDLPASITLIGSGFEAVANPNPSSYDNYNEYAGAVDGAKIPANGVNPYWQKSLNDPVWDSEFVFDSSVTYGDREFSIRGGEGSKPRSTLVEAIDRAGGASRDVNKYYVSWVNRFNESLSASDQLGLGSNKFARFWDYSDNSGGAVSVVATLNKIEMNANQYYPVDWAALLATPNQWVRYEYYIDVLADKAYFWINGRLALTIPSNAGHVPPGVDPFRTRLIGFDPSESAKINPTLRHWHADYYSQPTLARVELSNSPTFDDTVYQPRVYQHVTSRSDTEIVIPSVFYGELDQGQPIYAHIVKDDGSVMDYGSIA